MGCGRGLIHREQLSMSGSVALSLLVARRWALYSYNIQSLARVLTQALEDIIPLTFLDEVSSISPHLSAVRGILQKGCLYEL